MTLPILPIARLNATPMATHLDAPEKPAPQFDCMDDIIAAMQADAKQVQARMLRGQMAEKPDADTYEITNNEIVNLVAEHPGITGNAIADHFKVGRGIIYARMKTIKRQGRVKVVWEPGQTKKIQTYYVIEGAEEKRREKRSPIRDRLIQYIRDNPGCTTTDLVRDLGHTRPAIVSSMARARKTVNIETVKAKGGAHIPARYWVTG